MLKTIGKLPSALILGVCFCPSSFVCFETQKEKTFPKGMRAGPKVEP